MLASCLLAVQRRETDLLQAFAVKVLGREPARKSALGRRPVADEHGKPGIIAVAALGDDVLAERPFVAEPVAERCAPRRRIERIAFPFVAPVAERLENITRQEVLSFGAQRRAL